MVPGIPDFVFPEFRLEAILFIIPITLAPAIEHFWGRHRHQFGDRRTSSGDPGIKNTMLGDGIATMVASPRRAAEHHLFRSDRGRGPDRAFNPSVATWAAICHRAVLRKQVRAFLSSIPAPVMGGIMILLFGAIMVVGLNTLVRAKTSWNPATSRSSRSSSSRGRHDLQHRPSFRLGGIGLAAVTGVL